MLYIKKDYRMRIDKDRILLFDSEFPSEISYLSRISAIILKLIDQYGDLEQIKEELVSIPGLDNDRVERIVDKTLRCYQGIFCCENHGGKVFRDVNIRYLNTAEINISPNNTHKLAFPLKLVWITTWQCSHNCIFCGVPKTKKSGGVKLIDKDRISTLFKEAVNKGISSIDLHGGDTVKFYGNKLYDLLEYLTSNGIKTSISTRSRLSADEVLKLKNSGITKIQVSIDTIDSGIAGRLYSDPAVVDNIKETVTALKVHNMTIHVNTIITSINYKTIPETLVWLDEQNIKTVSLSWYKSSPLNKNNAVFHLDKEQSVWLCNEIAGLKSRLRCIDLSFDPMGDTAIPAADRPLCSSGKSEMLILPDGQVGFCDFLVENNDFIVGDLNSQSIEEVWNSEAYRRLVYPDRALFKGTKCHSCSLFSGCYEKGLCYLKSSMTNGKNFFSPDNICEECVK